MNFAHLARFGNPGRIPGQIRDLRGRSRGSTRVRIPGPREDLGGSLGPVWDRSQGLAQDGLEPAWDRGGNFPPIDHFLIRLVPLSAARARKVFFWRSFWMAGLPRVFHGG